MLNMDTNLRGRLRNTNLPKSNALLPLFEAVVNSIHAIDERIEKLHDMTLEESSIRVILLRDGQQSTSSVCGDLVGFQIEDNGIGFDENNYRSFATLDSDYKIEKGCRGVGRLLWLKEFRVVTVDSVYKENNNVKRICFTFNDQDGLCNQNFDIEPETIQKTIIKLKTIKKEYYSSIPKKSSTIAKALLEHCLWYFLRDGGAPNIVIEDGSDCENVNCLYDDYIYGASNVEEITIKNETFELTHIKLKSASEKNKIYYSAANRIVCDESLVGKIPGLYGSLKDGDDEFNYVCYVSSDFLTNNVNQERLAFTFPEEHSANDLFESELSMSDIRKAVTDCIKTYLRDYLQANIDAGKRRIVDFVNFRAPRYKSILSRLPEGERYVNPDMDDKNLELKLHRHLMDIESELIAEGHDLMQPTAMDDVDSYTLKLENYLSKVTDVKKTDLANYVSHRKVVIDLLEKAIQIQDDGHYVREEMIHKLVMPKQKESIEVDEIDSNLWLIDERLAFHDFLASDKPLCSMPIITTSATKEPDLCALNVIDNPMLVNDGTQLPLGSITVVEFKRPMRNDISDGEKHNPIEQALGYLNRIRKGSVKTSSGRPIPNSENIPGFCYIIADLTDTMKDACLSADMKQTSDYLGYYKYHEAFHAYVEVISFDRLLNNAKQRNRALFDKLGLPTR